MAKVGSDVMDGESSELVQFDSSLNENLIISLLVGINKTISAELEERIYGVMSQDPRIINFKYEGNTFLKAAIDHKQHKLISMLLNMTKKSEIPIDWEANGAPKIMECIIDLKIGRGNKGTVYQNLIRSFALQADETERTELAHMYYEKLVCILEKRQKSSDSIRMSNNMNRITEVLDDIKILSLEEKVNLHIDSKIINALMHFVTLRRISFNCEMIKKLIGAFPRIVDTEDGHNNTLIKETKTLMIKKSKSYQCFVQISEASEQHKKEGVLKHKILESQYLKLSAIKQCTKLTDEINKYFNLRHNDAMENKIATISRDLSATDFSQLKLDDSEIKTLTKSLLKGVLSLNLKAAKSSIALVVEIINDIISKNHSLINASDKDGNTLLFCAVVKNSTVLIEKLLSVASYIDWSLNHGREIIFLIIDRGDGLTGNSETNIYKKLIEKYSTAITSNRQVKESECLYYYNSLVNMLELREKCTNNELATNRCKIEKAIKIIEALSLRGYVNLYVNHKIVDALIDLMTADHIKDHFEVIITLIKEFPFIASTLDKNGDSLVYMASLLTLENPELQKQLEYITEAANKHLSKSSIDLAAYTAGTEQLFSSSYSHPPKRYQELSSPSNQKRVKLDNNKLYDQKNFEDSGCALRGEDKTYQLLEVLNTQTVEWIDLLANGNLEE